MSASKKLVPEWIDIEDLPSLAPGHPHFEFSGALGFLCAPLTAPQYLNCSQAMPGDAGILSIRYAAREWRGIEQNGRPVRCTPRNIDLLFADARLIELLGELSGKIIGRSILSEDELKN